LSRGLGDVYKRQALLLAPPAVEESVAGILAPIVQASQSAAVHLVLSSRTDPREEFSFVDLSREPDKVEAWIRWPRGEGDRGAMRVETRDRLYSFDGKTTLHWLRQSRDAWRAAGGQPKYEYLWPAAWLQKIVEMDQTARIVRREEKEGSGILLLHWAAPERKGLPPAFFEDYEREAEIRWDLATDRLTGFTRWVFAGGERKLYSQLEKVEYLDGIDETWFTVDLPAEVRLNQLAAASKEIDALSPREVAERFWRAAIAGDVETLRIFGASAGTIDWLASARPFELIRIGEPFRTEGYPGVYVPYEVRYDGASGTVVKRNLALRNDNEYGRWIYDGGL
ncbi:MAG: hypothetical protein QUU85_15240, partial [Candidatus Eisenbacteria bacterium]|nr:hypothetical protein [Candidatus Eisenbacteria bacterium]